MERKAQAEFNPLLTLEPLDPSLAKGHGQVEGDEVLVVADDAEELKFELKKGLY